MKLRQLLILLSFSCVSLVACAQDNPALIGTVTKVTDRDTLNVEL